MPFDPKLRSVLVIVDMIVDSVTDFWPVYNAEEVIANNVRVREGAYAVGIPVVQLQHMYRPDGRDAILNEARLADGITPAACVEGTPGVQIVPRLAPGHRDIVVRKHRWHGFFGTELDSILHSLGAEQLVWTGVFTEACLALSVFEGYFRDYPSVLIADAASCTNAFTHKTAVLTMANWIFDLTVFTSANFLKTLAGEAAPRWYSGTHNTMAFAGEADVNRLYDEITCGSLKVTDDTGLLPAQVL